MTSPPPDERPGRSRRAMPRAPSRPEPTRRTARRVPRPHAPVPPPWVIVKGAEILAEARGHRGAPGLAALARAFRVSPAELRRRIAPGELSAALAARRARREAAEECPHAILLEAVAATRAAGGTDADVDELKIIYLEALAAATGIDLLRTCVPKSKRRFTTHFLPWIPLRLRAAFMDLEKGRMTPAEVLAEFTPDEDEEDTGETGDGAGVGDRAGASCYRHAPA